YALACGDRAGERDLVDFRMSGQGSADIAIALDDIEQARGQSRLTIDLCQFQRAERRHLGRLEDHGIAHGQSRGRFPSGDLDRIIPCADTDANAEWLMTRVGEGTAKLD